MAMRKNMLFAAAAAVVLAACEISPEVTPDVPVPAEETETVTAVAQESLTKSDYTISGSTAAFEWTGGDKMYRLVRKYGDSEGTYSNYDHYTYYSGSISGATATFSGTAVGSAYEDTGYALYPASLSNGADFAHASGSVLKFTLNESCVYNADAPLQNVVPMVGLLTEGVYVFRPVTGVIGIKAKNIPSDATSISVSSTSGGFSGTSVTMTGKTDASYLTSIGDLAGPSSAGLKKEWFTAGTSKTYTFSGLDSDRTYSFYFPAPVGTYSDLTITLKAGDVVLGTVTASGLSLAVTRANIIDIAAVIDFSKTNYAKVALTGTSEAVSAYVESASPNVASVKLAVATTESDALSAAESSTLAVTSTGIGAAVGVSGDLTATGQYYLGYVACGTSGNQIVSGTLPLFFISATDAAYVAGTYKNAFYADCYPTTLTANGDDTITFEVSDNPSKGNIMLTQAFGFCWDVTKSTHTSLKAYDFGTFASGSPVYGFYNPSSSNPKLVFSNIPDQVFYYDAGGYPHFICEYGTQTLRFGFESNAYNSTLYDLICWGGYIMNCYTNTSSYDMYFRQFAANKQ